VPNPLGRSSISTTWSPEVARIEILPVRDALPVALGH